MARAYGSRTVALTVRASLKWVDNLLSQNDVVGVSGGRQGAARIITHEGLLAVEITRLLADVAHIPLARAATFAGHLVTSGERPVARIVIDPSIALELDVDAIERRLQGQLLIAVETASRPRRGRPPKRRDLIVE